METNSPSSLSFPFSFLMDLRRLFLLHLAPPSSFFRKDFFFFFLSLPDFSSGASFRMSNSEAVLYGGKRCLFDHENYLAGVLYHADGKCMWQHKMQVRTQEQTVLEVLAFMEQ